jgi:hypothetical protein
MSCKGNFTLRVGRLASLIGGSGGVGCRDILKFKDILKHRGTENTEKERGKRGEVEGGFIARVGSLVRRITVQ